MPKFTYSASKGIEQSSGSGFYVNDVPLLEEVNSLLAQTSDCGSSMNAYGVNSIVFASGDPNITLPAGSQAGQKMVTIIGAHPGVGSGAFDDADTTALAADTVYVFIYNGSAWVKVSA
jgi:hypothetical protein